MAQIMAEDAVRALNRCTAIEFEQPKPACLTGFEREAFAFLYTPAVRHQGAKGPPGDAEYRKNMTWTFPERMTRRQLRKFVETGDINFDDYPWDMNFYCCDIYLMDRFYFIPYRWEGAPEAWRNQETGQVRALWTAGVRVRRDGQLDGVNDVFDPEAFTTVCTETADSITANPVSPDGLILREPVTLDKSVWKKVLQEGDYLLALHIPGGMGYTPERVRRSCEMALAFFEQYYPEYHYLGFWSQSWLYDPGLAKILSPDRNIIRVQRQFYCYPTMDPGGPWRPPCRLPSDEAKEQSGKRHVCRVGPGRKVP